MKISEVLYESIYLSEAANPRTPHPEDSVFSGIGSARDAVNSMYYVIDNPETLTIKWDGFPALIFGYNDKGQFTVSDKYMFDKGPEYLGTSPKFWQEYDASRGKSRPDLYAKLNNIWNGLKAAVGSSKGFFWGDLMWADQLANQQGKFVFKPNTVQYAIPVNSELGKTITGTNGGVAVHQYFNEVGGQPSPWNSQGLTGNREVAILTPNMGIDFALTIPKSEAAKVNSALAQNNQLDEFLGGMDGVARNALQKYLGHVATNQTNLPIDQWLQSNVSGKQYRFLIGDGDGYLVQNEQQLNALFDLYFAIAGLKNNLANQLEKQVKGVEQSIGDKQGGEGFVFNTPQGLVKLVNRGGFSAAHFGKKK
jgi:hypothetical protein